MALDLREIASENGNGGELRMHPYIRVVDAITSLIHDLLNVLD